MAYIIAECGLNHNGSLIIAERMIKEAKRCGADACKFQCYDLEEMTAKREMKRDDLRKYMFSLAAWRLIKNICEENGVDFFCSVFDLPSARMMLKLGCRMIKIPSSELNNVELRSFVFRNFPGKVFISTGMSEVLDIVSPVHTVFMHCVSSYPCKTEDANISVIRSGKKYLGFSDHTKSLISGAVAVGAGATYIEKHFRLHDIDSIDRVVSLNEGQFEIYCNFIREAEKLLGDGEKKILSCELATMKFCKMETPND